MAHRDYSKSAALMLVYNHLPDFGSIRAVLPTVDFFLLIDNGSREPIRLALEGFCAQFPEKVRLVPHSTNLGLSRAYNHAISVAKELGAHWICLLDHDATFDATLLPTLQNTWRTIEREGNKLGMVVPIVTDDSRLLHSALGFHRRYTVLRGAITSGILTTVPAFEAVGGFDTGLYVEASDFEFTKRANMQGYRIGIVREVLICQEFEDTPSAAKAGIRLGNLLMRWRSWVQLGIGNGNMFRTRLSFYSHHRREELYRNLDSLIRDRPEMRAIARTVLFLDRLEELYLRFLGELPPHSGGPPPPNVSNTHHPVMLPSVVCDEGRQASSVGRPAPLRAAHPVGNVSKGEGGEP